MARGRVVRYDVDFTARKVAYCGSNGEEYAEGLCPAATAAAAGLTLIKLRRHVIPGLGLALIIAIDYLDRNMVEAALFFVVGGVSDQVLAV